jgi:hypothetical protein
VSILVYLGYAEVVICLVALCLLVFKKQWKDYKALGWFLVARVAFDTALTLIHTFRARLGNPTAYRAYFWVYWMSFAIESVLVLFIVYGIFRLTLAPLRGLLKFGRVAFCAVAGISLALAIGAAYSQSTGVRYIVSVVSELQRTQSLLTIGLVLFVFLAMRSVGISRRSKIFGVGLGLGVLAMNDLVQSASLSFHPEAGRAYSLINSFVVCSILVLWTAYFALPEPERGEINVWSPLVRWNSACLARYGM